MCNAYATITTNHVEINVSTLHFVDIVEFIIYIHTPTTTEKNRLFYCFCFIGNLENQNKSEKKNKNQVND